MKSELTRESIDPRGRPGRAVSFLLLAILLLGLAYQAILIFSPLLHPYRFPIPVPIFDTPFVLAALVVGYLCLERHRLLQDFRSAALGLTLWLGALLAIAHILAQPDYAWTRVIHPAVAPYFFFLSYLTAVASVALATHYGNRQLPLRDRARFWVGVGVFYVGILLVIAIRQIHPWLPSLDVPPGRIAPFAIWIAGGANGLFGVWALWGGMKRFWGREQDAFAGFLLLAALIWVFGLGGFLLFPFRDAVSWYVSELARPLGVTAIVVGLFREQVWLYREARARQRDLQGLHIAGQALAASLDPQEIVDTIASKALEISGADGAVLFGLDKQSQVLREVSRAGQITTQYVPGLQLLQGTGLGGLAVAQRGPVWTSNLLSDDRISLPPDAREGVRRDGLRAGLAIPLLIEGGEVFGTLSVYYRAERQFADTDVDLLSAYGTQVAVAIQNARAFEQLAIKAQDDEALQEFGQRLLEATEEERILNEAVRVTQDLLQGDYVGLYLLDPGADSLRLKAGSGWKAGTVGGVTVPPSAESWAGYSFIHKESVAVADLSLERRFVTPSFLEAHGVRSGLAVPMGVHDNPVGVIAAYYRIPHGFSDEETRVLLSLAHQTALALEKVRLYAELQANLRRLQETTAQLMQADKLKALGTLLSGMAHELNNPLSTILLSAQLVQQQALPDPIRRRIDVIEEESERASRIIRDLLVFARRKAPERGRVDLNEVVKAALALQAPEFDLHGIRVVQDLEPTLPEIWADPHQLQQVFLNLFTNATHAMKSANGRGNLTVRSSHQGSEAYVAVEDDGPGIPPDHLSRLFDPFFTTKGAGEGTGLGLSLSLGIVETHGGRMQAENLPGSGARFTVRLPLGKGAEPAETSPPQPLSAGHQARILVVDDEERLRETLTEVFSELGHQVEGVATGREAIASMERGAYDIIALDLRLRDMNGREVWRWIRSQKPDTSSRVVFVTGDTMTPDTQSFLQDAGCPVLTKPLTVEQVRRVIDEMLAAKPAGAA